MKFKWRLVRFVRSGPRQHSDGLDDQVSMPCRGDVLFSPFCVLSFSVGHRVACSVCTAGGVGEKRLEFEVDQSLPINAHLKNARSFVSTAVNVPSWHCA
jgi:hypothetical protein